MDNFIIEKDWIGEHDMEPSCQYNIHVGCAFQQCETCGWNPFVSHDRIITNYGEAAAEYLTSPEN